MSDEPRRKLPVVASYCATFLKPEMLHIYRQITSLERVRPIVLTRKRENDFPFSPVVVVPRAKAEFLRRIWFRQMRDAPWLISEGERRRLQRVLEREKAALLHIYFGHIAVRLLPLLRSWSGPALVSFHGADVGVDLEKSAQRAAWEEMLARVRRILVRSESLRRVLLSLGAPEDKIALQPTGIPILEFSFRPRTPPAEGRWQLVQASRLIEKKGIATTLRAFQIFREAFPGAKLTIAGEGPELEKLTRLAGELRLSDAIAFSGFLSQPELRSLFERSHLFVHPSQIGREANQEGVPNSMLEAMATGLPIFATRHGGIPEAVEDGISGRLVAEGDAGSLARAMIEVAKTPRLLAAMSAAARDAVAQRFDRTAQTRRLEDIYLQEIRRSLPART